MLDFQEGNMTLNFYIFLEYKFVETLFKSMYPEELVSSLASAIINVGFLFCSFFFQISNFEIFFVLLNASYIFYKDVFCNKNK